MPSQLGYQDLASLLARQPGVAELWQKRVFSAAASIQLATYSFARPIGTSVPESATYRLASLDGNPIGGALARNPVLQQPPRYQAADFPIVNRVLKGDRLVVPPAPASDADSVMPAPKDPGRVDPTVGVPFPVPTLPSGPTAPMAGVKTSAAAPGSELDPELQDAMNAPPLAQGEPSAWQDAPSASDGSNGSTEVSSGQAHPTHQDGAVGDVANLFFGSSSLGGAYGSIERWRPGEEPAIVSSDPLPDPDMKVTALLPSPVRAAVEEGEGSETIAAKGEVNVDNQQVRTPAERLGLVDSKARGKAERCLAEAVYFEARGEAVRGQIAVAQVVMNRAFSGYYPSTVCGVVFQSKYRHSVCQFTFACEANTEVIREPDMWERAKKIAKAMLDGLIWLPEVGKSTHYHAYYVRPSWVSEMKRMYKFGVHTFYRPRAWGDGSDAPSWGTPQQTAAISAELAEEAKSEAELNPSSVRR